jgi:hypothetical protein
LLQAAPGWSPGELQLGVRLAFPESPERIRDDAPPGRVFRETDAQCPRLTARHASGASCRFANLLKNASRIFQEQAPGDAELRAARQPVEQLEPQLGFPILNLRGQSRLGDVQPLCRAPGTYEEWCRKNRDFFESRSERTPDLLEPAAP